MPLTNKDIELLKSMYPWPDIRPGFDAVEWVLDGGGKELIVNRICKNKPFLIVEIGVFLGSSVKRWLTVSPNIHVIAIDPWEGEWWVNYAREHGRQTLAEQFAQRDGPYLTFLSSLWEFKERIFPVRGRSPEKLYELAKTGIKPDLIYLDSDKTGVDIEVAHMLFPSAILTGDDWTWGIEKGYPIRRAVREFAGKHNYTVISKRATWVLVLGDVAMSERYGNYIQFVMDIARMLTTIFSNIRKPKTP